MKNESGIESRTESTESTVLFRFSYTASSSFLKIILINYSNFKKRFDRFDELI